MADKRIAVWVQKFPDRANLMLQWHDRDTGRRKSTSAETDDLKKAQTKRADLEADLNAGRYVEASRMTWERFRTVFTDEYVATRRTNTQRNYRFTFDAFEKVCNPQALRSITERTVSAFAAGLRAMPGKAGADNMRSSTIRVRLQSLRAALRWAVGQKLLAQCPRFPVVKVSKRKPQPVPTESVEKLLDKAEPQMRAYLLCGWLAGMRLNEALALEWHETDKAPYLDPDRNRIVFPAETVKADEDQWVPLDPALWQALNALPREGGKVFQFYAIDGRGARRVKSSGMAGRIANLARAAGVKMTYKSLRRGYGCRYAAKVPAQVLQKLMRHADIAVTLDYYANVDDAVFEAVLGSKRNTLRNNCPPTLERADSVSDTSLETDSV
jgi:integrase